MKLQIRIKTPKGRATKTEKIITPLILGVRKLKNEKFRTNKDDSIIIWEFECDLSRAVKINKSVALYDKLINMVFNNKIMKRGIKKKFGDEGLDEVEFMLKKQTNIKVLKEGDKEWEKI